MRGRKLRGQAKLLGRCFVSGEHRFVYFEVPKAACTSIKAALLPLFPGVEPDGDPLHKGVIHRAFEGSPYQVRTAKLLEERGYRDFYKFSFVRNPWDRLFSCYRSKVKNRRGVWLTETSYSGGQLYPNMPFREFVEVVCRTPDEEANPHFRSQAAFLFSPKRDLLPDFVGRFENLAEDFREVAERIGVDLELPHANPSRPADYRRAYGPGLARTVEERYREDVDLFDYSF